jgi:hypothetical protein
MFIFKIIIGIIVELFGLIPSIFLVQLFRRIRDDRKQIDRKLKTFPWWFIFIAYGLCAILVGLSIIFLIARGIEFGDLKTQKWLTSILTGFFSSIFLIQPLKVKFIFFNFYTYFSLLKIVCLMTFFVCLCRKSDGDEEAKEYLTDNQFDLDKDEEYLHSIERSLFIYRSPIRAKRLNEVEIVYARYQRLKQIHMWTIIQEGFIYLIFLSLILMINYSNQHSNSFLQVNHLKKYLFNSRQSYLDYNKVMFEG